MADGFMPEYWPANRIIGKLEKALVKAENILGLIQSAQIENLIAGKITGLLTSAQIEEIEAAKVSGKLTSEQIESIKASQISGKLTNAQLESIEAAKITGVITETQIGPEAVTTPKLKAGAITTAKLAAGSVTAEILAAGSVTTEKLVAGSVNAGALAAGSVTTAKLAAEAITAEKIGAGQILTAKLAAGAVTAEKLSVVSLSAISANLGTVTAGTLKSVTIESGDLLLPEYTEGEETGAPFIEWGGGQERIVGAKRSGVKTIELRANDVSSGAGQILLECKGENASIVGKSAARARFYVESKESSTIKVAVRSKNASEAFTEATVFSSGGVSSFLQIAAGAAKRNIAFGTATMTQTAGSKFLNTLKVAHGLGTTALVAVGSSDNAAINIAAIPNASETQIELRGYNDFGTEGLSTNVRWIAIG